MLSGLIAATLLCVRLISREREELQRTTHAEARHIAAQLGTGVLGRIEPLERMGQWWLSQGKPFDREDWRTDGQLFLSGSPGLVEAAWVGADGLQRWSAKPEAEPNWKQVRPDPRVRQLIAAAKARGSKVISDVFSAPDTPAAFYACVPVSRDRRVWGYVIGLYDAPALISSLAQTEVRPDNRISILSGEREVYSAPSGGAPWYEEHAQAVLELPGQTWTVALRVPLNYFREFRGLMLAIVSVIGALLYAFTMLLTLSQRRSSELQRANDALANEVARRVRTEAEVRDLNRELSRKVSDFQTLLDVIPIGIAVAGDPECRSITVNPALARMLGVPQARNISSAGPDAAGLPYKVLRDGRELRSDELPIQVVASTKRAVLAEEDQLVREDGTVIDVLSFASPVFDENGAVRGVLYACVDISERKAQEQLRRELEQRLQRAQRMKSLGAMAAGIAHDFNNLLTGIIGHAALAAKSLPEGTEPQHHIASSLEAADRAANLVHQLLAYTGRSYHTLRPTNLGEVVRDMRPALLNLAGPQAVIRFKISSPLPNVMADPDEIRHVLDNLVLNAIEAKESDADVEISVGTQELSGEEKTVTVPDEKVDPGTYVRVEVKDSGAGMPAEIAERAFDPFFSTKFLGRGLGLSEVLGIMRAHNGAVRLETARDEGTSVELFFPVK